MEMLRSLRSGPIEPVARVGEYVLLADRQGYRLFTVAFVEGLPPSHALTANIGALAAGATSAPFSLTNLLDMQYGELGQFRARVLDDFHAILLQPQAVQRWGTMNQTSRLNAFGRLYDPCDHLSEFYIFEDQRVWLTAQNPTGYALAQARVSFYGVRYVLANENGPSAGQHLQSIKTFASPAEAKAAGFNFTVIPAGGWVA